MTPDARNSAHWERVRSLFAEALERPLSERDSWLRRACNGDDTLRAEVRSLLAHAEATQGARTAAGNGSATSPSGHPAQIGPYRILSLLGEGGMGAVYEAEQAVPRRHVALKVLRIALASEEVRRRFALEGEVLGRLRHPAVAQVYEMGTATLGAGVEAPWLAMEHVRGARTLTQFVRETSPSREALLELFCEVVDGIEHAHQQGIVHRDLKPANVLVDADGRPKVIDFGLARAVKEDSDLVSMHTQTGQVMGTPRYMSPEQFEGKPGGVGLATDIYSLGVLLYELISGKLPHDLDGLSIAEIAQTVRDEPPRRLADSTSTRVRDDLDTIVAKALEKLPERRYETAAALAADVRRYLRNEPILARPASVTYRSMLFVRRHRLLVAGVAVVLAVAITAAVVSLQFAFDARRRADEADRAAYSARILGAGKAIEGQNFTEAAQLLAATPEHLRGWEYRHLASRLDTVPSPWPADWKVKRLSVPAGSSRIALLREVGGGPPEWVVLQSDQRTPLLTLPAKDGLNFELSPDGKRAVSWPGNWYDDSGAVLWQVDTGASLAIDPPDRRARLGNSSSPSSWNVTSDRVLLSYERGFEVRDGSTGTVLAAGDTPNKLRFTADERYVLDAGNGSPLPRLQLLDARSLTPQGEVLRLDTSPNCIAFRGSQLVCSEEGGSLMLVDFSDGTLRRLWRVATGMGNIVNIAWSPDGGLVAIGAASGSRIRVYDAVSGAQRHELSGSPSGAHGLLFQSGSGDLVACGLTGEHLVLSLNTRPSPVLSAHKSYVYPVVVSADGSTLLTGGWDGFVGQPGGLKRWDARTGALVAEYGRPGEFFLAADLTPDGRHVVACIGTIEEGRRRTEVIDLRTGSGGAAWKSPAPDARPFQTAVLPDGQRALTTNSWGEAAVWDLRTGEILWTTDLNTRAHSQGDGESAATASPDGRMLAVADGAQGLRLVDARTYADVRRWDAHESYTRSLAFSRDSRVLLSASEDQTVGVWDVASGSLVARLIGHGSPVLCAAMSPDGTRIASGGRDGLVRLWDTTHFQNVARLGGHTEYIFALAWSPDGRQLFSTSGDTTVRLWDTRSLSEQLAAAKERKEALPRLESLVARARNAEHDPEAALAAAVASPELTPRERELAEQVAARFATRGAPAWYRAPRAGAPIAIDGRIDEAEWGAAPWSEPFIDIEGDVRPAPRLQTRMRMLWDDTALYVAARLDEPHVWGVLTQHDDVVYWDNDFEVFLDPEGDSQWYGEVEVNALATIFDLRLNRPYIEHGTADKRWSPPGVRAAVAIDGTLNDPADTDRGWTVEIAIPHAAFADHATARLPPQPRDVWRINFSRVQWQHDIVDGRYLKRPDTREDNWVWTPQRVVDMHRPAEWGFVEFAPSAP